MERQTIPKDLSDREYSIRLLECELCWPLKGNIELMMDCLHSIGTGKRLTPYKSYVYMARSITLARSQGKELNRFWFTDGEYTNIRPARKEMRQEYKIDAERTKQEQNTPEWKQASEQARRLLAKLAGRTFDPVTNSKEKLKAQAELLQQRGKQQ